MAAGLILSLGITFYFSFRAAHAMPRLRASEEIRPWMTLSYIAHAHQVPAAILYQAVGLPYQVHDRRPILRIARSQGVPVQTIISELQTAIQQYRPPGYPTPTPAIPQAERAAP